MESWKPRFTGMMKLMAFHTVSWLWRHCCFDWELFVCFFLL